jgi:hypothetical protein
MARCRCCGVALTLFIDHLKRYWYWYCQVCGTTQYDGSSDG